MCSLVQCACYDGLTACSVCILCMSCVSHTHVFCTLHSLQPLIPLQVNLRAGMSGVRSCYPHGACQPSKGNPYPRNSIVATPSTPLQLASEILCAWLLPFSLRSTTSSVMPASSEPEGMTPLTKGFAPASPRCTFTPTANSSKHCCPLGQYPNSSPCLMGLPVQPASQPSSRPPAASPASRWKRNREDQQSSHASLLE